jgi:dienelactone hydrolase
MNTETANETARGVHNGKQPDLVHMQHPVSYLPAQTDDVRTGEVTDTGLKYTAAGHAAATHGMASRPRGAVQTTMDRA